MLDEKSSQSGFEKVWRWERTYTYSATGTSGNNRKERNNRNAHLHCSHLCKMLACVALFISTAQTNGGNHQEDSGIQRETESDATGCKHLTRQ